ncbi:MBOAT family O-acyltransferase [Pseudomonas luteola]
MRHVQGALHQMGAGAYHSQLCPACANSEPSMIFSSFSFLLLFLPLSWLGFALLRGRPKQWPVMFLTGASWIFYALWDWRYLLLLWASMAVNYVIGIQVWVSRRRAWLIVALVFNLGVLAYYKYLGFFASIFGMQWAGEWVLPLAISFYTFQQIAWQVDLYRKRLHKPGTFSDFVLCVSFFPHLIAGPICRPSSILPQIEQGFRKRPWAWQLGFTVLCIGLAKKVLLADSIAPAVDALFAKSQVSAPEVLLAALGYGVQLYFDFSGYADMAIGLGLIFGIKLPVNFRSPYRSLSVIDFWRRWHISLSRFLRDYLYVPLGGSRQGYLRQMLNLMITMLLGGLWHGAGWNFILWGALHGFFLCLNHLWRRFSPWRLPASLALVITLFAVMLAWVPFRASDLSHAIGLYKSLMVWNEWRPVLDAQLLMSELFRLQIIEGLWFAAPFLLLCTLVAPRGLPFALWLSPLWRGLVSSVLLLMVLKALIAKPDRAFLYFNF